MSTLTNAPNPRGPFVGDDVVPDAEMVFDRARVIRAAPDDVWPWVVQLGKHRGGWYLPHRVERWMPARTRAARAIVPEWQGLAPGDRVADYGGPHDYFDVVSVDAPRALVYRSERFGTTFTWALLLHSDGPDTLVHLRFRGRLRSRGIRRRMILALGDLLDWSTTTVMLRGLAERVE